MTTGITNIASGNQNIDALLGASRWSSGTLTFNFPLSADYFASDYLTDLGPLAWDIPGTFQQAPADMQQAARLMLQNQFSAVANLTFTEVAPTAPPNFTSTSASQQGGSDISISRADLSPTGVRGIADSPGDTERAGDVWIDVTRNNFLQSGSGSARNLMHELGHALGLKHGHEAVGGLVAQALPADLDTNEFTVMTYRRYVGGPTGDGLGQDTERGGEPQSLMMLDIQALQYMYGANFTTNANNTVYTFSTTTGEMFINGVGQGLPQENRIYRTIWDGNGIDTYDFSNYTANLFVDLRPGAWSILDPAQLAKISVENNIFARGSVFNALQFEGDPRSLIENVNGGSGNDVLRGNGADNTLRGNGGNDALLGGTGNDTAVFTGDRASYTVRYSDGSQTFSIQDTRAGSPDGMDSAQGIETFVFNGVAFTAAQLQATAAANTDPVITPTPAIDGAVAEDGTATATGTLTATDPDTGVGLAWSIDGAPPSIGASFQFALDNLTLIRNGVTVLSDPFTDGNPPPAIEGAIATGPSGYNPTGTFTEAGGRLILSDAGAVDVQGVGTSDVFVGQAAVLITNINPMQAAGLKDNVSFTVEALFDLVIPDSPRERYGIRLSDRQQNGSGTPPDQLGDDVIDLVVQRSVNGTVNVLLREVDFVADETTVLQTIALTPPPNADQILLRLSHADPVNNRGVVTASFDYLADGVVVGTQTFSAVGQIFGTETAASTDDETWTRVHIVSGAPKFADATLVGTYGSLTINQAGRWDYALANAQANVQALAEGQVVTDTFTVVVTDEFGGSDTEQIAITVTGDNDAPTLVAPIADQSATEGTAFAFTVPAGTFADVDTNDTLALSATLQGGAALPSWLTFTPATRDFSGTPSFTDGGTYTIVVTARDGSNVAVSDTFVLTVNEGTPVNLPPTADADGPYAATEDTTLTVSAANGVLNGDVDPEGGALIAQLVTGTSSGALTLNANGSFSYTPEPNFNGTDSFVYRALDVGGLTSADVTVQITVVAVNDAPGFTVGANQTVAEDAGAQTVSGFLAGISAARSPSPSTRSTMSPA